MAFYTQYGQAFPGQGRWYFDIGTGHGGGWTRNASAAISHRPKAPFIDWMGVRRNPARDWWDVDFGNRTGKWMSGRIPADASVAWPRTRSELYQIEGQGHPRTPAEEAAEIETVRLNTERISALRVREAEAKRMIAAMPPDPDRKFVMWRPAPGRQGTISSPGSPPPGPSRFVMSRGMFRGDESEISPSPLVFWVLGVLAYIALKRRRR